MGSEFKALMGVSVTLNNKEKFRRLYDEVLNDLFRKYSLERKRVIYKASFLTEQLLERTNPFISEFLKRLESEIIRVDVYYTFYPDNFSRDIITCSDSYPRAVNPIKFMNNIYNSYPHYCIWKYIEAYNPRKASFEVDFFSGKITPAWNSIKTLKNIHIYFSGCECNKAISLADIIQRYIVNTMRGKIGLGNITRCLRNSLEKTEINSHFMGPHHDYLSNMAYTDNIDMDNRHFIVHPIYWMAWQSISGHSEEKNMFEWNQRYIELMRIAELKNGCVRYYEPKDITQILDKKIDIICLMNEKGNSIIEAIKSFAPEVNILSLRE